MVSACAAARLMGSLPSTAAQQQRRHQAVQVALQLGTSRAEGGRQRMQAGRRHLGMRLPCSTVLKVSQDLAFTRALPHLQPIEHNMTVWIMS